MNTAHYNLRTFYTIVLSQTFSLIGSRISSLAIGFWIFAETGEATPLALIGFFTFLPQIISANVSGLLADRWDRRYVMILADVGQAITTVILLLSFLTGTAQLALIYAVVLIQAMFSVFQGPAFQASITTLVPESHRDRANTIMQLGGPASGIIAPAIAGVIYAATGVIGAIMIDIITFLVAVIVLFIVRIPQPEETEEGRAMRGSMMQEITGGFRYIWLRKPLVGLLILTGVLNFFLTGASVLNIPYILLRTDSEASLGFILSVTNLGALIGGIAFGIIGSRGSRMNIIFMGLVMVGIFVTLTGTMTSVIGLAITGFGYMFAIPMINASIGSIMQVKVAPDLQGRVFSVIAQMSLFLTPLAQLLAGPLADQVFEPAIMTSAWNTVAPIVGDSAGAGIGLIRIISGLAVLLAVIIAYTVPSVRNLDVVLPDYAPKVTAAVDAPISDIPVSDTSTHEDLPPDGLEPVGD